ncbi:MAG: hypothetical protein M3680_22110 [Myxococcota bacterium]|nr:hypothetical protein [Myxococcota bacterium]
MVPPTPRLVCDAGTTALAAPAPEPTWSCTRADGTRHGPFVTQFPDGSVAITGAYRDGVLDGAWERRHPHGGVAEIGAYGAGLKVGTWRQHARSGAVLGEYVLVAGTGIERRWFDGGPVYSEVTRKSGLKHGAARVFLPDGTVAVSSRYLEDQLDGPHVVGSPRAIRVDERYTAGVRTGPRKLYLYGSVIAEENFDRQGKHHGSYVLWRSRNVPRVKGQFEHGARVGTWVWHDRERRKEREGRYLAGQRDGRWTEWWDTRVVFNATYRAGRPHGELSYYDRNGLELGKVTMTDGTGTLQTFHPNRKPATRQQLVRGVEEGLYQELTPRGKVTREGRYRGGAKHGVWKEWTADGVLLHEQTWKRGKLDGSAKKYAHGTLSLEAHYVDGRASGPYVEHRSGKPAVIGAFAADRKHGTWTHHGADGAVVLTASYEDGVLEGPWRQLVGGVVLEGTMRAGRRSGTWIETDRAGAVRTLTYD